MRHFGFDIKLGFESQHVKFIKPSLHKFVCKDVGVYKLNFTWLGVNLDLDLWIEPPEKKEQKVFLVYNTDPKYMESFIIKAFAKHEAALRFQAGYPERTHIIPWGVE